MECARPNLDLTRSVELTTTAWWIEISGDARWATYHRLQELAIDCHCHMGQPLQVRIDSPQDLVQCWSVMRHAAMRSGDRLDLAAQLETCWKLTIK
jgi:hypothetical protein